MTLRAGRLRHYVTVEQSVSVPDSHGEPVLTWTPFARDVPAGIEPLQGREFLAAQKENVEVTHRVVLRWIAGVNATMRVVFNGRILEITSALNRDERNEDLTLMCKEVVA